VRLYDLVFARGGTASLVSLAGGAGAVLILSMPWAGKVADFFRFPWRPTPTAVLISVAFFAAIHAFNRGGTVELLARLQRRQLLSLPLQVLFAQLLVVPYFVACAILTPGSRVLMLGVIWAYIGTVDLALSLAAFHVGRWAARRGAGVFLPVFVLGAATFALPLVLGLLVAPLHPAALLSSPYAVFSMLTTELRGAELGLAFGAPAALAAVLLLVGLRQTARSIHEQLP
jgi:hypothetical protein